MGVLIQSERSPHPCIGGEGEKGLAPGGASSGHLLLLAIARGMTGCLVVQANNLRWREVREHPHK
jgi:hypothetical protein